MESQGKSSEINAVATTQKARQDNDATNTGHEAEYWRMADALRGSMDAAEYKHVVLGLIFLKYISDAFEERHAEVLAEWYVGAAPQEDDGEPFEEKMAPLAAQWREPEAEAQRLDTEVEANLAGLGVCANREDTR